MASSGGTVARVAAGLVRSCSHRSMGRPRLRPRVSLSMLSAGLGDGHREEGPCGCPAAMRCRPAFACTMSAASDPLALGASRCTLRRLALVVRPHLAPPRVCVSVHLWYSRIGGTLLPPILHTPLSSALVPPGTCLPSLACRVHGLEDEDQKHAKAEEDERVHVRRWPGSRLPLAGCLCGHVGRAGRRARLSLIHI